MNPAADRLGQKPGPVFKSTHPPSSNRARCVCLIRVIVEEEEPRYTPTRPKVNVANSI